MLYIFSCACRSSICLLKEKKGVSANPRRNERTTKYHTKEGKLMERWRLGNVVGTWSLEGDIPSDRKRNGKLIFPHPEAIMISVSPEKSEGFALTPGTKRDRDN